MVNSMTGYGRAQQLVGQREISVEIKSVNHRYFEFSTRIPRSFGFLEEKLKAFVYAGTARGKVDVAVSIVALGDGATQVQINRDLAEGYLTALRELGTGLGLQDDLTLSTIARFGDIFTILKSESDEEEVWQGVRVVAAQALEKFQAMKQAEGAKLEADVIARLSAIEGYVAAIETRSAQAAVQYRERLFAKLQELLADVQVEESRILTEAAIFAEKTAVAEETVRLRSHIEQMRNFFAAGGDAVGRKMDFLVQEMNRETNTIGSKAQDIEMQRTVVEIKSEIEKIREQIQNIE